MKRFFATAAAVVALSMTLGACGGGGGSGDGGEAADLPPDYVLVKNSKFIPAKLRVAVGAEVTFDFADGSLSHNAVADDKSFDTGLHTEKRIPVKITKAGTYKYICTIHPTMKGEIIAE